MTNISMNSSSYRNKPTYKTSISPISAAHCPTLTRPAISRVFAICCRRRIRGRNSSGPFADPFGPVGNKGPIKRQWGPVGRNGPEVVINHLWHTALAFVPYPSSFLSSEASAKWVLAKSMVSFFFFFSWIQKLSILGQKFSFS